MAVIIRRGRIIRPVENSYADARFEGWLRSGSGST